MAAVAGGAALAEVTDRVKDEPETADEPRTREIEAEKPEAKEKAGRSMFDRIANRLKKHGDEKKANEEKPTEENPVSDTQLEQDDHDGGAAVVGVAVLGVGAGTVAATRLAEDDDSDNFEDAEEREGDVIAAPATFREPQSERDAAASDDVVRHDGGAATPFIVAVPVVATAGAVEDADAPFTPTAAQDEDLYDADRDAIAGVAALPGMAPLGTGAEAPSDDFAQRQVAQESKLRDDDEGDADVSRDLDDLEDDSDDEQPSNFGKGIAATVGIAALGGMFAAGAAGAARRRRQEEEEQLDAVSSLNSTDDDEPLRPELQTVASAEHTGAYTFAGPAAGLAARPDLERHISTIQDSSSDEADDESDELADSDGEDVDRARDIVVHPVDQTQTQPIMVDRSEETPARDRSYVASPTPAPQADEMPVAREESTRIIESRGNPGASDPVLSEISRDESGNLILAFTEPAPPPQLAQVEEHAPAPAPTVKTGPSAVQEQEKSPQDKESKGLRGFFSKLKNKSKADNKLQKEPPASEGRPKATTAAAVPAPGAAAPKEDDIITPVTTTSAGREAEQHIGTDGPIGDPHHISGIGGDPRAVSPSSFKRSDLGERDLDDVSSSGADEGDYARGRAGRLAKKLGLSKGTTSREDNEAGLEPSTSNGDDEQFEEARDTFDESLAPPPAFAGQAKSESPNRTTRFQEQL